MSEKPESEEFDEDEEPETGNAEDVDVDRVMKDLDLAKRRGQKLGEPAWRRLERLLEEKRTADLVSDFEDYDVGGGRGRPPATESGDDSAGRTAAKKKGKRR